MAQKKSGQALWTEVDNYFTGLLAPTDPMLEAALKANQAAGLPAIDVSPLQGKFLHVLVQMTQASRVLEIGLLGGYSTIWMARALHRGGRIVSLEFSAKHAEVARGNLRRAGLLSRVDIRVGPALESLPGLVGSGPFDLIFIDADKGNNPKYLKWAIKLAHRGTVIVVDNVARHGHVIESDSSEPDIVGTRSCMDTMANHPRLSAFALQTVGLKGLDGFALAVVTK
jgi:predicted O-methyltransferase YrrM